MTILFQTPTVPTAIGHAPTSVVISDEYGETGYRELRRFLRAIGVEAKRVQGNGSPYAEIVKIKGQEITKAKAAGAEEASYVTISSMMASKLARWKSLHGGTPA